MMGICLYIDISVITEQGEREGENKDTAWTLNRKL